MAASVAVGSTGGWQSWRSVPGRLSASGRHTVHLTPSSGQPADSVDLTWSALA